MKRISIIIILSIFSKENLVNLNMSNIHFNKKNKSVLNCEEM